MAYQFQKISERDLARGVDQRSTENTLKEGYAEVLQNVDTNSNGFLSKRPGYEGYYGSMPIRVKQVIGDATTNVIEFILDSSINTAFLKSSPLVAYGFLGTTGNGDWVSPNNNGTYYTSFSTGIPDVWVAADSVFSLTNDRHSQGTKELLAGSLESTSSSDNSNSSIFSSVTVDAAFTIDYNFILPSDLKVFMFAEKKSTIGGLSYSEDLVGSVLPLSTKVFTVTQADHQLDNLSIIMSVYEKGTPDLEVFPPITIDTVGTGTVGEVTITISNTSTSLSKDYRVVMTRAPIENTGSATVGAFQTDLINISNFTDNFYFYSVYENVAGLLTKVLAPVSHDDAADTLTASITNGSSSAKTYEMFYERALVTANSIKVEDTTGSITADYDDTNPQITLWGLPYSELYTAQPDREGHVTHIDSYRRANENRVVAGIGGNLFTARTRAEVGVDYLVPSSVVNIQSTIIEDINVAPAFGREISFISGVSGDVSNSNGININIENHGFITGDPIKFTTAGILPSPLNTLSKFFLVRIDNDNLQVSTTLANATAGSTIAYVSTGTGASTVRSGDPRTRGRAFSPDITREGGAKISASALVVAGEVSYTLELDNKTGDTIDSSMISTDLTKLDQITVTGMSLEVNNGVFDVKSVTEFAGGATIVVYNTGAFISDFDESGASGRAAVYTDQFVVAGSAEYIKGDRILGSVFAGVTVNVLQTIADSPNSVVVLDGIRSGFNVPSGLKIFGSRSTDVIPLDNVDNFLRKDMCEVPGVDRRVRVTFVNPSNDLSVASSSNDGTGLITITVGTAHNMRAGQKILMLRTGIDEFDGTQTITSIGSSIPGGDIDLITFQTTDLINNISIASSPIIKGNTIEIDEALTVADDGDTPTSFAVEGRWIPVEAPSTLDTLPASNYFRHFDANAYTSQSILRSGIVNDNMYFTNGDDEVMKFDGTNLYQAGIFRWQPQLFVQQDIETPSIPRNSTLATLEGTQDGGGKFIVKAGEASQFAFGDRLLYSPAAQPTELLTVKTVDTGNNLIFTDETPTTLQDAADTLRLVDRYRYYFRLNAIDANQNIIASAATGANDFIVEVGQNTQIKMKLVGFPTWGIYDYDALELEIYRTSANTASDYRLMQTIDLDFSNNSGYIEFVDGTTDESRSFLPNDLVHTALKGSELGTAWSQPLRAKYSTVADNVLILANVKDYPQLDIQILTNASFTTAKLTKLGGGDVLLFRRDSADAGTVTDMNSRVSYEFIDAASSLTTAVSGISGSGTVVTFTSGSNFPDVVAGDWIYAYRNIVSPTTKPKLRYAGWFQIAADATSSTTITVNNAENAAFVADEDITHIAIATDPTDVPVYIGEDFNYGQLNGNLLNSFTSMARLANAMNASMCCVDRTLIADFVPWLIANAGSEYSAGQIVVRQEKVEPTTPTVVIPTIPDSSVRWFVHGISRAETTEVSASTQIFNSRVLVSYANFPEVFDNPFGDSTSSDSVVDINAADGQEITGIIPFFGRAVFGSSQIEGVVVVFKTNSIYLLDIASKQFTKIQSRGLGCIAPFSIATTRDGIMFANESGVYRLNRDQSISYVGKFVERIWQDEINRDNLSRATGHHYAIGRKYKLSLPVGSGQTNNNEVLVYDHQREGREQEFGAWTRYTNHSATGWTNLANDAFFATTDGQVFRIRVAGDSTDFRDDDSAVADMVILLRANDFGQPGSRKIIKNIVAHFQLRRSSMTQTDILSSADLDGVFTSAGAFNMTKDATIKVDTESVTLPRRRLVYVQLKFTNSTKDEDVVLAGVDYNVALLSEAGIKEISE